MSVGSLFCLSISLLKKMIFLLETTTYSFFQPCRLMFCLLGVCSQPSRLASVSPSSVSVPTKILLKLYRDPTLPFTYLN